MDAQGGSANVVQVEASACRESKIVEAARVRSVDYEPIIAHTVASLVHNTPDRRRTIYEHARSVVMGRVELETLALDLAIEKIERRWRAREAAENVAAGNAIASDLGERRRRGRRIATISIAGRLVRRVAGAIGVAAVLAVTAATVFDAHVKDKAIYRTVSGAIERWFSDPGGEPGATARVALRDRSAGRGSTPAAPADVALPAAAEATATTVVTPACGSGSSISERNPCERNVSGRGTAAQAPKTENAPRRLEGFSAFSDMTPSWELSTALSGPVVAAEDFAVGNATPFAAQAPDAAPASREPALPRAAPPQATPPEAAPSAARPRATGLPQIKPVNAKVAALIASGKEANLKGDLDLAVRDFSEAIRIDPKYPDTYSERGQAFFKLGDIQRAIADYSAALAHDPQHGVALRARGMAQLYLGKNDLALADLSKAIELGESDPRLLAPVELFYARRSRGSIYESTQQYDLEIADCTALIESYAHDQALADALAANYGSEGAANVLAKVYRQRASAFARRSSVERAVADLTQAIPLSSDQGYAALIDRSKLHEGLGRRDLAAADARAALNIRPGSEEARLALSRLSALSNAAPPKGL